MIQSPDDTLRDRVCLVTGSTSGIGKATVLGLAGKGATVLAVSRDRARGEALREEVERRTGNGAVSLLLADLSEQASVRRLAREVAQRHDRLLVLVNNAGVLHRQRRLTADGIEATLAVNHLAPFLLTQLLLDRLQAGAPARVVNVASDVHRLVRMDFDDLQCERGYRGVRAYSRSKLANVLFTYELARRLAGTGVTANCLHPGGVRSGIWRESRGLLRLATMLMQPFLLSAERGAAAVIHLASSPAVEGVSGKYFRKGAPARSSSESYDEGVAARLWRVSAELAPP